MTFGEKARTPLKSSSPGPIVKWVGGKRQLLDEIIRHLPDDAAAGKCPFYEPFIGGAAVLFQLQPEKALINDTNTELINLYRVIKSSPEQLISDLGRHRNESEYFYEIRSLDRDSIIYSGLSDVERASRIIFLNKTCYNGLYRLTEAVSLTRLSAGIKILIS